MTIHELKLLREAEDKVEFKAAKGGNYSYNGGGNAEPKKRRHCILGYIIALANEGGGHLVFGMADMYPHEVVGTQQSIGSLGTLEQEVYRDTKIRISATELFDEKGLRVLVIKIPSRPIGKVYKFEDVALMRVGEDLLPMSDEQYFKIIQEQEPDFSAIICDGLKVEDLDLTAIQKMKEAYAQKQANPLFLTLGVEQCLTDLHLLRDNKLTYAALILLGSQSAINKYLPQAAINLEYRNSPTQITFDDRKFFNEPYYVSIDKLWDTINLRNGKVPVQQGPYIFDIPFFNKEVIREAVNNAVAHRDYRKASETVIKQYPQDLHILSPGGFPIGVNLSNLVTVNSTPRNRLLAEVLAKTGIVERSGQGIDKIFYQCLAEAKGTPDYTCSDDFQVELKLSAVVKDKAFAIFINQLQEDRKDGDKLSVQEIITLDNIRQGKPKEELNKSIVDKLIHEGLVEKTGSASQQKLRLAKTYYSFSSKEFEQAYIMMKIKQYLQQFEKAKMRNFVELFSTQLTREQVKTIIYNLSDAKVKYLEFKGNGPAREYFLGANAFNKDKIVERAIELGFEEMRKRGELKASKTDTRLPNLTQD